jgi:2-methylcitrate dehydratase PrpD
VSRDLITTPIDNLSQFLAALSLEQLPEDVVLKTKVHIADTLGAALAGTCSGEFSIALKVFSSHGAALVWGTDRLIAPRDAALLNGVASHAFELDDSGGCDHSGAVVLPALLAALSDMKTPISGEEFIVAVNVGYEVGRRVLEACGGYDAHSKLGWHSTGTCGAIGAAAAVAKLKGLDAAGIRDAITLATSFSSGLWAFIHDGSQAKKIHAGRAAEGGLLAAQLASEGYAGPLRVFDDVWGGFFNAYNHGTSAVEMFDAGLGDIWKVNRAVLKPYASCRGAHSSVDALQDILRDTGKLPSDIASMKIRLSTMLMDMCGSKRCDTMASAQMSLPYALAARIAFGTAGLKAYDEDRRLGSQVQEALNLIELIPDASMLAMDEPYVSVHFTDGTEHTSTVPRATGSSERPMPIDDIKAKFDELASMALSYEQTDRLWHQVMALESNQDARSLFGHLSR